MESLKELNSICQKPRYKEVGNWYVRHILRDAALPITWLLLHTSVSANQVTLAALAAGILSVVILALPGQGFFLTAVILLHTWYLLDHVDGQIARYRKTVSLTGRFFDFLMHHIVHGILFFGLGFYSAARYENGFFLIWGFVTAFFQTTLNLLYDVKYKTYFEFISQRPEVKFAYGKQRPKGPDEKALGTSSSRKRRFFIFLYKSTEMHVILSLFLIAALAQALFLKGLDLRLVLFVFYGLLVPLVSLVKINHWIRYKKIDDDFKVEIVMESQESKGVI